MPPLPGAVFEADGRKGASEVEETYFAAIHACVNVELANERDYTYQSAAERVLNFTKSTGEIL